MRDCSWAGRTLGSPSRRRRPRLAPRGSSECLKSESTLFRIISDRRNPAREGSQLTFSLFSEFFLSELGRERGGIHFRIHGYELEPSPAFKYPSPRSRSEPVVGSPARGGLGDGRHSRVTALFRIAFTLAPFCSNAGQNPGAVITREATFWHRRLEPRGRTAIPRGAISTPSVHYDFVVGDMSPAKLAKDRHQESLTSPAHSVFPLSIFTPPTMFPGNHPSLSQQLVSPCPPRAPGTCFGRRVLLRWLWIHQALHLRRRRRAATFPAGSTTRRYFWALPWYHPHLRAPLGPPPVYRGAFCRAVGPPAVGSINLGPPCNPHICAINFADIVSPFRSNHTLITLGQAQAISPTQWQWQTRGEGSLVSFQHITYIRVLSTGSFCDPMAMRGAHDNLILITIRIAWRMESSRGFTLSRVSDCWRLGLNAAPPSARGPRFPTVGLVVGIIRRSENGALYFPPPSQPPLLLRSPDVNPQARLLILGDVYSVVSRQAPLDPTRSRLPPTQLYTIWSYRRSRRRDGRTGTCGQQSSARSLELGKSPPGRPPATFGQAARTHSEVMVFVTPGHGNSG